jgi:hypothetical protein
LKKLAVVGLVTAATIALTGCSTGTGNSSSGYYDTNTYDYGGYSSNGGWTDHDWDMNYGSVYNNNTYCAGGTYKPLPHNQYSCTNNGVVSKPAARPKVIVPPKSQQKAPASVLKRVEQQKAAAKTRFEQAKKAEAQKKQQQQKQQQQRQAPAQKAPSAPKAPSRPSSRK